MTEQTERNVNFGSYVALLSDLRLVSIVLMSFVGTLGINVASPALPGITDAFAVTDTRVGLVVTVYTLPAMLLVPITGILADVHGRRTVVIPSLLLFGAAGAGIGLVDSFLGILALRGVQGMAFAGVMPLSVTLLGDLYSGSTGSTAQGLRVGINGISSMVIPPLAGFLSGLSWSYPFFIYGFTFPVAILVYVFLPETAEDVDIGTGIVDGLRDYGRAIHSEIANLNLSILISGGFARDFVRYGVITFVPLFAVRVLDASFVEAGAVLSARGFAYVVVSPVSGLVSGYLSRKYALIGALGISAGSVALIPLAPSIIWLGVLMGTYSVGDSLFSPVIKDAVTDVATDEYRGGVVSGMNVLKYGAQTASPAFFGLVLAVLGFDSIFVISTVFIVSYAAVVVLFLKQSSIS